MHLCSRMTEAVSSRGKRSVSSASDAARSTDSPMGVLLKIARCPDLLARDGVSSLEEIGTPSM